MLGALFTCLNVVAFTCLVNDNMRVETILFYGFCSLIAQISILVAVIMQNHHITIARR